MQVNQALPLLLDLLLVECWDTPGTLEVLLCHLPQPDLRSVLRDASETGFVSPRFIGALTQTKQSSHDVFLFLSLRIYYCSLIQVCQPV